MLRSFSGHHLAPLILRKVKIDPTQKKAGSDQNPTDIPLYWLVKIDPPDGLL